MVPMTRRDALKAAAAGVGLVLPGWAGASPAVASRGPEWTAATWTPIFDHDQFVVEGRSVMTGTALARPFPAAVGCANARPFLGCRPGALYLQGVVAERYAGGGRLVTYRFFPRGLRGEALAHRLSFDFAALPWGRPPG